MLSNMLLHLHVERAVRIICERAPVKHRLKPTCELQRLFASPRVKRQDIHTNFRACKGL